MEISDWVTSVIAVLALLVAVVGVVVARRSNQLAKDANTQAEIAAKAAADGVVKADEANRIAEQGNEVAREANAVAERALQASTDDVHFQWLLEIDEDADGRFVGLRAVNDCAHMAHETTLVVDSGGHVETTVQLDAVPAFGPVHLAIDDMVSEHLERAVHPPRRLLIGSSNGNVYTDDAVFTDVRLTVTARTNAGVLRSDVVQKRLRTLHKKTVLIDPKD